MFNKKNLRIVFATTISMTLFTLTSCKKDNETSTTKQTYEINFTKYSVTPGSKSATIDGITFKYKAPPTIPDLWETCVSTDNSEIKYTANYPNPIGNQIFLGGYLVGDISNIYPIKKIDFKIFHLCGGNCTRVSFCDSLGSVFWQLKGPISDSLYSIPINGKRLSKIVFSSYEANPSYLKVSL